MEIKGKNVVVIGGGSTGVGVVRDAAMRGFRTVLVDKGDLAQGTSGRYHGLLHSGGRYVVSDPESATECAEENAILKRIQPGAIEATGGLFVVTPHDPEDYADGFLAACAKAHTARRKPWLGSCSHGTSPAPRQPLRRSASRPRW